MIVDMTVFGLGFGPHSLAARTLEEKVEDLFVLRPNTSVYSNVRVGCKELESKQREMEEAPFEVFAAEGLAKDARLYLRGVDLPEVTSVDDVQVLLAAGGIEFRFGKHLFVFLDGQEAECVTRALADAVLSLLNLSPAGSDAREVFLKWAERVLAREQKSEETEEPGSEDQKET